MSEPNAPHNLSQPHALAALVRARQVAGCAFAGQP
jgi:hypothetical protein